MTQVLHETTDGSGRCVRYADGPIPFEEFLDLSWDQDIELIDGVMVAKTSVQLTHEKLFAWLFTLLNLYVKKRDLGIVLGSRTAVEIGEFGGRLPDILFVRRARLDIVRERAVYGAPDLVIELVSPNDRPSDLIALETDYRSVKVAEIVFIDQQKGRLRVLRRRDGGYNEETLTAGTLRLETVEGFEVQTEWLLREPRPDELDTLVRLLGG